MAKMCGEYQYHKVGGSFKSLKQVHNDMKKKA